MASARSTSSKRTGGTGYKNTQNMRNSIRLRRLRRFSGCLVSCVAVFVLWRGLVGSRVGQTIDALATICNRRWAGSLGGVDRIVLDTVSTWSIAGVVVASLLIAIVRRRWTLGVRAVGIIVGGNLTTRILKAYVFYRPDLHVTDSLANSLPSGHTTAAATGAIALLVVAPVKWRSTIAVLGALWVTLMGGSTVINEWHRPSDVIAAICVSLAWGLALTPCEGNENGKPPLASKILTYLGITCVMLAIVAGLYVTWTIASSDILLADVLGSVKLKNLVEAHSLEVATVGAASLFGILGVSMVSMGEVDRLSLR